jgi:hypothetical protein
MKIQKEKDKIAWHPHTVAMKNKRQHQKREEKRAFVLDLKPSNPAPCFSASCGMMRRKLGSSGCRQQECSSRGCTGVSHTCAWDLQFWAAADQRQVASTAVACGGGVREEE